MKGMALIVSDVERALTKESLAQACGLDANDPTDAIFQKLYDDGIRDVPALMDWARDLLGKVKIWGVLEYLQVKFDKGESTEALLKKWFSKRGVGEHLQPQVRLNNLTESLTEIAQQVLATTSVKLDALRLMKTPLATLMRYTSLFYWRELERYGHPAQDGKVDDGDPEVIEALEELSLSELCRLLNCIVPLKASPYLPNAREEVTLSSGAAGAALSRLADMTGGAWSDDRSGEFSECLIAVLEEWHGDDPYIPMACAVAKIVETISSRKLTCYDEMGGTVILDDAAPSLAYGDDVLIRSKNEGEVWASKLQAVPRSGVWEMPENIPRKGGSERTVTMQARNQVFISYSHIDKKWLEELQTFLAPYIMNTALPVWDDSKIAVGADWRESIEQALAAAKVAVLLVSPAFLKSKFIIEHELLPLLKAAESKGVTILWVPLKISGYLVTPIAKYQAVIDPEKPLTSLSPTARGKALLKICNLIQEEYQR
jgi:hypothetical protein